MTKVRRILTALIVLAMVISMVPVGYAAEVTADDVYVLQRNADSNIQYASPYSMDFEYDGAPPWKQSLMYSMVNSTTGEIFPTYCMDIQVEAKQ